MEQDKEELQQPTVEVDVVNDVDIVDSKPNATASLALPASTARAAALSSTSHARRRASHAKIIQTRN